MAPQNRGVKTLKNKPPNVTKAGFKTPKKNPYMLFHCC